MDMMTDEDRVAAFFHDALAGIPWPCSRPPGLAENETYVTYAPVSATAHMGSNQAQRLRHLVQLHAYSRGQNDEHRAAFFSALSALKAQGVRVYSWGPDEYEADTGLHHIACTCTWWQAPNPANEETEG